MEISRRLRAELEEILRRKGFGLTVEELAMEFERAGRSAPCRYFSALAAQCHLGYELDCLTCSKYVPHERPGPLESAICRFGAGRVYHIMEFAESDGFYRWGRTLCGRFVDEKVEDVEIYDEGFSDLRPCALCKARMRR